MSKEQKTTFILYYDKTVTLTVEINVLYIISSLWASFAGEKQVSDQMFRLQSVSPAHILAHFLPRTAINFARGW